MLLIKKASMFGLDARIALAVISALSVISSASIYSAIQDAEVIKLIVQADEVKKAYYQYKIDTKKHLPRILTDVDSSKYRQLDIRQLIENNLNVKGWKGPYLTLKETNDTLKSIRCPATIDNHCSINIYELKGVPSSHLNCKTITDTDCAIWVGVSKKFSPTQGFNNSILELMDKKIDSSDGRLTGDFIWDNSSLFEYYIKLRDINPLSF